MIFKILWIKVIFWKMMVKWKMDINFFLNIVEGNRKGGVVNYYEMFFVVGIWSSCRWFFFSFGTYDFSEYLVFMMYFFFSCSVFMGLVVCFFFSFVLFIVLDFGMVFGLFWFLVVYEYRNDKLVGGLLELRVFFENFYIYWLI